MAPEPQSTTLTLPVLGMSCAACQHHVESALLSAPGVEAAHVSLMEHRVSVRYDARVATPETLVEAIRSSGYDSAVPRTEDGEQISSAASIKEKSTSIKTLVTLVAGFVVMLFSMPLGREMGTADHALMHALPWIYLLPKDRLRWILLLMTASITIWAGRGIYLAALRALAHGTTNMNTLVGLGTTVAFAYSAYATVWPTGNAEVYFDAVLLIVGFLLAGKELERRARLRALAALDSLSRARPTTARRIPAADQEAANPLDSHAELIPLAQIQPGDNLLVLPGERFPVDGVLIHGQTTVDESMLTGESTPIHRTVGDQILAGSMNYDGAVICRAESLGAATVLARIAELVQQAQSSRTPLEGLADRTSKVFVPVVLGIAGITFFIWLLLDHSVPLALANAVSVLVIACPCAMGLAVPAALTVAVGRGAQLGVLFKGGEALERLTHLNVLVLDKTGTLTVGRPTLIAVKTFTAAAEADLLRLAAAAEEHSNHPLAHALVEAARQRKIDWKPAEAVQVLPGRGLTATVEGQAILLGNAALIEEQGFHLPLEIPPAEPGVTRLWMACKGQVVACFDARDTLRPGAVETVAALRKDGLELHMLTGDSWVAAEPIAHQVGITQIEADLDPAAKLSRIRNLQAKGLHVGMVGDGINDAAALAQADAGIALGTGADLAQEAGDVLLLRPDPQLISAAIQLAHATTRIMRQNLLWAAVYNLLGIPLAAGALYPYFHLLLSPWLASVAMALSSVSVLANSLRLRHWSPRTIN